MFNVGDKVVYVSSEVDFLDDSEIHEVSLVTENGLYKVQGLYFSGKAIRHTTPEEIAAGHRIDTNTGVTVITTSGTSKVKGGLTAFVDMGDDSHIENHVSPNCKVGVK